MIKKIFSWIFNTIGIILIIILCIFLASSWLPEDIVMNTIGHRIYIVVSDSMTGIVNYGDAIVIKKVSMYDLKPGDIITFKIDYNNDGRDEVFTHFVASVEAKDWQWMIHTKPSVSEQWDNWVLSDSNVIGKGVYRIPGYGLVVFQFRNPLVLGGTVAVLCIVFAIAILIGWKEAPKEPEESIEDKKNSL